ncbi:MAG TPA: hypothetical protein VMT79_17110 [Candidatus Binatia bacterium]|nr:hypothetical protein [Candidatus Binatia bacterium]
MKPATTKPRRGASLRNFHLPLPEDTYEALRLEASRLRKPATVVAREAIEKWLEEQRRAVVREAIAAYAVQHAGSAVDLDPALESAGLEAWHARKPRR